VKSIDGKRVHAAIRSAEEGSTGRVAVRVLPHNTPDALESARESLHQAELHKHPHRNAVIFLVAPKSRRFAVYGDDAIHERVGETFWEDVVAGMTPHFKRGDMTGALEHGIGMAGKELRAHFPADKA
jgi:uncharacterized membrane protein